MLVAMIYWAVSVWTISFLLHYHGIEALSDWNITIKTCDSSGSGTDASVYLKVYYPDGHDHQTLYLNNADDNFERGQKERFGLVLRSNDLITIGLYYWPSGTLGEAWCVDWAILSSHTVKKCYVALFDKWIGYYSDPPTYPKTFRESTYYKCIN